LQAWFLERRSLPTAHAVAWMLYLSGLVMKMIPVNVSIFKVQALTF
jgi:hypothetical protein